MDRRILKDETIPNFYKSLLSEEKSRATIEKYLRDVKAFFRYIGSQRITKETVIAYKAALIEKGYAVRSINSMLASLNSFFAYLGRNDCRVKNLKLQNQAYCAEEKELTRHEYMRLLRAAESDRQLHLLLETLCGTGIRVSEVQHFSVELVRTGEVTIRCKGKIRSILIPRRLQEKLLLYAKQNGISTGAIFVTRGGKPLNRSNIWARMKTLCEKAGVAKSKVFPHNLRKLFARTFYTAAHDIARLADILGHSSIDTTRIYIMTTGQEHRRRLESLGLVT